MKPKADSYLKDRFEIDKNVKVLHGKNICRQNTQRTKTVN